MSFVYHAGEIEVQTRAGVRTMAKRVGNGIHKTLIAGAAEFLAEQPMVIVGSRDREGHVWASILSGNPGFAYAADARTVHIRADPAPGLPLTGILAGSARDPAARLELGILVIDLQTRERLRLNGWTEVKPGGEIVVQLREVYFNCPKYIQKREVTQDDRSGHIESAAVTWGDVLTPAQCEWIAMADTFFIASAAPGGADASHRGGNPGFVHVQDAATLVWPDYSGNAMFNTLGNITINPNAGLLFLDFEQGNTLQLTGQADVVWEPERAARFSGAERVVAFHIEQAVQADHVLPLHFRFLGYSRFNPA